MCIIWIIRIYIYFFLFENERVNIFMEGGSMKKKMLVFVVLIVVMSMMLGVCSY